MENIQILQLGASLLGGGAVGAMITAYIASYKVRLLPVGRRIEVSPLFTSEFGGPSFSTSVTVTDGQTDYKFPNLHLAEVQIVNRGNRDLAALNFGITLSSTDKVVHVEPTGQDRHHVASAKTRCTPDAPLSTLDFELRPFNRGDSYTLKLFIVASAAVPESIAIGSAEPVRFTEIPSVAENLAAVASTLSVMVGPFEVRFQR